ncbi:cuticle protein AM1199-like [Homarus americanus]|uniref:cuticle protein AM1199-like n=1 Tax=Homarus americanus TaxID=6706 RepID=UPI001C48AE62|nr:cuticle protein AM1199-like [Homarus americanus]
MATVCHQLLTINTVGLSHCKHQSLPLSSNMKFVILAVLAAVATAAPQYSDPQGRQLGDSRDVVPILEDNRFQEEDGRYSVDVKTGNGIILSQSGSPSATNGAVVKAGEYSYTAPDGTLVEVKFIADENGFQPQSNLLPVAPAFPHPIPQFVLDQIAFAATEDPSLYNYEK